MTRFTWNRATVLLFVAVSVIVFVAGLLIGLVISRSAVGGGKSDGKHTGNDVEVDLRNDVTDYITPENILDTLRFMSSKPHMAGSARQEELADWLKQKWEEFGADHVEKTPYNVLLSYPDRSRPNKISIMDNVGQPIFETAASEKVLAGINSDDLIPPFTAFSPAKEAEGELVYVNYGMAVDFEKLETVGVNCSGKIVIARFGKSFRGNKVALAQKYGAVGIILYSDPAEFAPEGPDNVFPNTTWLPGTGVQRGSIGLLSGDQLTQGYPAKDYAYRTPMDEWKKNIQPQIPCQPIGYDEAWHFLSKLAGADVPAEWAGGLNITYRLGPGFSSASAATTVRIQVYNTEVIKTIYNVVGRIDGAVEPDRYVIVGSHRDAWMYGTVDAVSSQTGLVEMVRAFGKLKKSTGWRPRRTLIFISWGGEEYGMIGSYEWVEEHWKTLQDRAVAYLNGDTALSGNYTLRAYASPVLKDALIDTTKGIPDPHDNTKHLYDTWRVRNPEDRKVANGNPKVKVPASGTDYAHFLYFAGIPITYHTFRSDPALNQSGYAMYHTGYETFHLIRLMDPHGKVLTTVAQVWARLAMTLLDAELLPLNVSRTAEVITQYVDKISDRFAVQLQAHGIDFDPLRAAGANLSDAAAKFEVLIKELDKSNPLAVRQANDKAMKLERMFLDPAGQPDRPLLRHVVFSPSSKDTYTGAVFSGLGDLMYDIDKVSDPSVQWIRIKKHFAVMIHAVQSAADFLLQP